MIWVAWEWIQEIWLIWSYTFRNTNHSRHHRFQQIHRYFGSNHRSYSVLPQQSDQSWLEWSWLIIKIDLEISIGRRPIWRCFWPFYSWFVLGVLIPVSNSLIGSAELLPSAESKWLTSSVWWQWSLSEWSVHILYNADGVGVGLGFVIVCYIW